MLTVGGELEELLEDGLMEWAVEMEMFRVEDDVMMWKTAEGRRAF